MPFFREYHTTFDRQKQVMRFAKAGPDCQPLPMPVIEAPKEKADVATKEKSGKEEVAIEEKAKATTEEKAHYQLNTNLRIETQL